MNGKKMLISSVLSLSLLVSGVSVAPAFASTGNTESSSTQSDVSTRALIDDYVYKTENKFINVYTDGQGITWYLKGITYSSGYYIGHYQANI